MESAQKTRIVNYAKTLNSKIENEDLLDFAIEDCAGRVLLYLGEKKLDVSLERIISSMVAMNYARLIDFSKTGEVKQAISSVSDNGQSVSYSLDQKRTLTTAQDDVIFLGFESILKNYRRICVIS
nr:MAG TPA: tail connector protein [Caudoviricetes sp.]